MDADALLLEFARGGKLIRENAEQLYREACALRDVGAYERAAALHQLSNEECGKLEMLGGFAMAIAMGGPPDLPLMEKRFRDHAAKNYANAYFSEATDTELAARTARDWKAAQKDFLQSQKDLHRLFNAGKNASLYVDFDNGVFTAPSEVVDASSAEAMEGLNAYLLELTSAHVRLLNRLSSDDAGIRDDAIAWARRIMELRRQVPDDLEGAFSIAYREIVDRAMAARQKKG